jgi:hypothetical protein
MITQAQPAAITTPSPPQTVIPAKAGISSQTYRDQEAAQHSALPFWLGYV